MEETILLMRCLKLFKSLDDKVLNILLTKLFCTVLHYTEMS